MVKEKNKVLIVEDDAFLLRMYALKFEQENFEVFSAEDGEKGLKLATQKIPDIILLDIMLPKKNGFEVLEELKAQDVTRDIPVVMLTNLSQKDEVEKGLNLGADDYLIKAHFMPSEVVEKAKKLIV